ncbi:hypothetical protein Csp2054_07920 [Curtobacterium sp. 'Ferrero']|uniref:LysM peptidoglycan-binding domain-containing protein n=1 Tax=Curtobacterium sp. 'Ferrero' TaxID=2033654 RepID=UPI000BD420FB|nr:LysM domain-containing protein [Curtobacterium sp. 'Ferrero']PCN48332.1 hypothetical protein Csp2054_07920 [Curtobacterium sp. 'Ferrero']
MRIRSITVAAATALLGATVLGGCANSTPPDGGTATVSSTPTTSPSPTPAPTFTSAAADLGPQPAATGTATPVAGGYGYTVAAGDAVTGIAARFGLCVNDVYLANAGIFGLELSVGQSLTIRRTEGPGHTEETCDDPNPPGHD